MLHKILFVFVLLVPVFAHAEKAGDISTYLVGKWNVESIQDEGGTGFHPPRHPVEWEFTKDGKLIEELGASRAKIHWNYHVVGRDIKVQLGNMGFSWRIISMEPKVMLVKHQLGLFKVVRIKP
jgi:hypothetical protein